MRDSLFRCRCHGASCTLVLVLGALGFPGPAGSQVADAVAEELPPMQAAHVSGGAVVHDGKLHVWTGYTNSGGPGVDRTLALEVYDPAAGSWARMADAPVPRNAPGSFLLDGLIYQVAGEGPRSGSFSSDVHYYDPASDTWTPFPGFPTRLWEPRRAVVGGRAFMIGGRHGYTATYSHVYECDPAGGGWIPRADMPYSVKSVATIVHDGLVYLFGGEHKNSESHSEWVRDVQVYDHAADTWERRVDAMPWLLLFPDGVAACGDQAYLFANRVWDDGAGAWVPNESIYRYSFTTGAWDVWARLLVPPNVRLVMGTPIVLIDGYAYMTELLDDGARSPRAFRLAIEAAEAPADIMDALRLRKDPAEPERIVHLDWDGAPTRRAWERYRVLRGDVGGLASQPLPTLAGAEDLAATSFTDPGATGPLWFYDVRTEDCFGNLSPDPWPPGP